MSNQVMSSMRVRYLAVASYAARTSEFARTITQVHDLGYRRGNALQLWTDDFQRRAIPIYFRSLPVHYLRAIEAGSRSCAHAMAADPPTDGPRVEWLRMAHHYQALADAIADHPSVGGHRSPIRPLEAIDPSLSGLLRYDELAALVHPDGAMALREVASVVHAFCRRQAFGGVSEQEIAWLQALARGERTIDVAACHGHSERGFYRALSRLWDRLGVTSRSEALALAAQVGWLDEASRAGAGV
jgi:DNA-binding CsgD family transcriptional regulator